METFSGGKIIALKVKKFKQFFGFAQKGGRFFYLVFHLENIFRFEN